MADDRDRLLRQLLQLAQQMLQGSISQTTRTCGNPNCRCHRGQRHGPHTYLTFRTPEGRSSSLYVPVAARAEAEAGVAAWRRFQELAAQLGGENRKRALDRWRQGKGRKHRGRSTGDDKA